MPEDAPLDIVKECAQFDDDQSTTLQDSYTYSELFSRRLSCWRSLTFSSEAAMPSRADCCAPASCSLSDSFSASMLSYL